MYFIFCFICLFLSAFSSEPWILTPDSAYSNLILKIEGYPEEYNAELPIPNWQRHSVRELAADAIARKYGVDFTQVSTFITIPEAEAECFKSTIYSKGIVPVWVKRIKN